MVKRTKGIGEHNGFVRIRSCFRKKDYLHCEERILYRGENKQNPDVLKERGNIYLLQFCLKNSRKIQLTRCLKDAKPDDDLIILF